jgi:hypothetical protein
MISIVIIITTIKAELEFAKPFQNIAFSVFFLFEKIQPGTQLDL